MTRPRSTPPRRSRDEQDRLVRQYIPMLYRLGYAVADDATRSYMMEALWKCARLWDPGRGRFITIAWLAVRRAKRRAREIRFREVRGERPLAVDQRGQDVAGESRRSRSLDSEERHRRMAWCLDRRRAINDRDRRVLLRRMAGDSLDEVGAAEGLCRERIRQIQAAALRVLRREARLAGMVGDG